MATTTRIELTECLIERLGIPYTDAWDIVNEFFEQISLAVEKGEVAQLAGFGNFNVRHKVARPGRNPKTGEPKEISARTVVTFRPGKKLLNRMPTDERKC